MFSRLKIQHRLAGAFGLGSMGVALVVFILVSHIIKDQLLAHQVQALLNDSAESNVTQGNILSRGVLAKDFAKFNSDREVSNQGFIASDGKLLLVKKENQGFTVMERQVTAGEWYKGVEGLLLTVTFCLSGFVALFMWGTSRLALQPLTDLRRTTEDILAGRFEVKGTYAGRDEVDLTFQALKRLCTELEKQNKELEKVSALATTDGMTGLKNHRAFKEAFEQQYLLAQRHKHPLTLIIVDVDHFKKFNDTYGHQQGDEVLKIVAKSMGQAVRASDFVARYGGEEFVVILPQTDLIGAQTSGEKLRKAIESAKVSALSGGEKLSVTASFGGFTYDGFDEAANLNIKWAKLIEFADQNLYKAKKAGRNKVVVSSCLKQAS